MADGEQGSTEKPSGGGPARAGTAARPARRPLGATAPATPAGAAAGSGAWRERLGLAGVSDRRGAMGWLGTIVLGLYLLLSGLVLVANVYNAWPPSAPAEPDRPEPPSGAAATPPRDAGATTPAATGGPGSGSTPAPPAAAPPETSSPSETSARQVKLTWLAGSTPLTVDGPDDRLLLIVILMGALGSWLHATSSFAYFVGNRKFIRSWLPWYVLRPFIGAALALVFYFVLRGGLAGANAGGAPITEYSAAGFAAIVGLFAKKATEKLGDVLDVLFPSSRPERDQLHASAGPEIDALEPEQVPVSDAPVQLRVRGDGFSPRSQLRVRGTEIDTAFVEPDQLVAELPADLLAAPAAELPVVVVNPDDEGGRSAAATLKVVAADAAD